MTTVAALYNSLPTIEEANRQFVDRDELFSKLAPLLAMYDNSFGVCLVHAHCKLDDGEVMVTSGDISRPEHDVDCYPERWLANGEPYEYSREPTVSPPRELWDQFKHTVEGVDVLGLYFAGHTSEPGVRLEWTKGRTNRTKIVTDISEEHIETGWLPGTMQPVTMMCVIGCVSSGSIHRDIHY